MSYESQHVKCLVCGLPAYELQLCREHLDDYHYWKHEIKDDKSSTNRVDEYVTNYDNY
jgi:hypothetical protein